MGEMGNVPMPGHHRNYKNIGENRSPACGADLRPLWVLNGEQLILREYGEHMEKIIKEYWNKIDWSITYKDNDVFPEVCPLCHKRVFINFYGSYNQSYMIHCETPHCMVITSRGL